MQLIDLYLDSQAMHTLSYKGGPKQAHMTKPKENTSKERRFTKYLTVNAESFKILNQLEENDLINNGKSKKDCQAGYYVDKALKLLAREEGLNESSTTKTL